MVLQCEWLTMNAGDIEQHFFACKLSEMRVILAQTGWVHIYVQGQSPSIQCEYRGIRFYIDCSLCCFHTFTIILIHINFQCQSLMKVSCTFAKTNRVFKTFGQRFSKRSLFHHMVLAILTVFVLKNSWKWVSQAAFLARSFLTNHD